MSSLIRALLLGLALVSSSVGAVELRVEDAWIRQLPPAVPVRSGYLRLFNPLSRPVRILAARSSDFGAVEFHRSTMRDGMMTMEQQAELEIGAGAELRLEPGGLHLMLMQPANPGKAGETRRITFHYDDGSSQELLFEIRE